MNAAELEPWLRLDLCPGVGSETARKLLACFGSAQAIFEQTDAALAQLLPAKLLHSIRQTPAALSTQLQTTQDWLQAGPHRAVVTLGDASYPSALLDIADPPLILYMLGSLLNASANTGPHALSSGAWNLAMVGSRNPTPQGHSNAQAFARSFAQAGMCVVSGLALGVDGAAHEGALLGGGPTIAVVGTGLDRVYPKQHRALAHRISEQGLLISEFALGTPPLQANFPRRNRLISGLSLGTLVVEAALQSGSLITARMAAEQGKEVFAMPGSIHSPQSRGCHALLKQGAKLVERAEDVLEELNLSPQSIVARAASSADHADEPSADSQDPLLQALGFDAVSLDALQARTGWDTATLQAQLLSLELAGFVGRLPGGLFQRLAQA